MTTVMVLGPALTGAEPAVAAGRPVGQAAGVPAISVADLVVGESVGQAVLTMTLSAPSASAVSVFYSMANATAVSGSDYLAASGTLTFTPHQRSVTLPIVVLDDLVAEPLESFYVFLSSPVGATVARSFAVVSIVDDDTIVATPRVVARDVVVDEKVGTANVPVLLGGPDGQASTRKVTVTYATANGSAIAGSDYTASSGTLTFLPGQTVAQVPVPVIDDGIAEPAELFAVRLTSATNATIGTPSARVTIGASDGVVAALPAIRVADLVAGESDGWVDLTFSLSAPSPEQVSAFWSMANGNAVSGSDYLATSGTVTFLPGYRTATIRTLVLDDLVAEPFESFFVSLSSPSGGSIARSFAVVSVVDDDSIVAAPRVAARDVVVDEKVGTAYVPVLLGGPAGQASTRVVTVAYATAGGTAASGTDFVPTSGTLTFLPGETEKNVPVGIVDDTAGEKAEAFALRLSAPTNATIGTPSATVTIGPSDGGVSAQPGVGIADLRVSEGIGVADLVVTLGARSTGTTSVFWSMANGTAVSGSDYLATSGVVTFLPGERIARIRTVVLEDATAEPAETFSVFLSSPSGVAITRGTALVTLLDND